MKTIFKLMDYEYGDKPLLIIEGMTVIPRVGDYIQFTDAQMDKLMKQCAPHNEWFDDSFIIKKLYWTCERNVTTIEASVTLPCSCDSCRRT